MGSSTTDSDTMSLHAPKHPVPQLQGPFEESMVESITETVDRARPDPIARRAMLLERPAYERVCAGRWKQKPGERFHPLWKISAQMSFGIHLLAEGLAKSEEDVMAILQTHVDDVDGFLESTTEDFDLAQSDIAERLRYLKLPLEHVEVFDRMLEDRTFRISIVEGNEKIEHIMARTSEATKDALKDVQKGLQATDALGKYLEKVELSWTARSPEHDAVFTAMVGNVEGWHRAFEDLYQQGTRLGISLVQLASIVSEMQRRAGVASRKTLLKQNDHDYASTRSQGSPSRHFSDRNNFSTNNSSLDVLSPQVPSKPLPLAPGVVTSSKRSTRRTSFQESRPRQTTAVVSDKTTSDIDERRNQAAQRAVSGETTKRLKNQKSAPNLKAKSETSKTTDFSSASELRSLGLGAGLGLGQIKESAISHPVTLQRQSAESDLEKRGSQLKSNLKSPEKESALVLHTPVKNQVPLQRKPPSFSLRNKNKDKLTDSQLNPPKASSKLMKSALSPRAGTSVGLAAGVANSVSPALSASRCSPDGSYNNASANSSPRIVSPGPGQTTSQPSASNKPPRKYTGNNPTFTSHPPNMEMATSPSLKEGQTPKLSIAPLEVPSLRAVPDLDSGNTSYESSLGEPGPEVCAADESDVTAQEAPIAELDSGTTVVQGPIELEAAVPAPSQTAAFELEAPQPNRPVPPNTSARMSPLMPTVGATIQSHSDFFKLPPQQVGNQVNEGVEFGPGSMPPNPSSISKNRSQSVLLQRTFQLPAGGQSKVINLLPPDFEESNNAARHRSFKLPPEVQSDGNSLASTETSEWQARMGESRFELPADSDGETTYPNTATDEPRATMQHNGLQLSPGSKAKDPAAIPPDGNEMRRTMNHKSLTSPSFSPQQANGAKIDEECNDKSGSHRDNGRTLPSRISTSEVIIRSKRQSPKHHLNLIEIISHTPPGSPIHERPTSSASFHSAANSARLTSYRASVDLAPPEEAPPPPAPGGRSMVTPDYATVGAFEGEKRPKRTSGASMSGLKKMFSGGSASHSRAGSVCVVELPEGRMSGGSIHDNVDLMTPGGSDVLWFKGMGRDGVWVSGS